jgi:hypothetical protein
MDSVVSDGLKILTVEATADFLKVSTKTVRAKIKSGELVGKCVSRDPNSLRPRYVVTAEALAAYLRQGLTAPLQATGASRRRNRTEPTSYEKVYEE